MTGWHLASRISRLHLESRAIATTTREGGNGAPPCTNRVPAARLGVYFFPGPCRAWRQGFFRSFRVEAQADSFDRLPHRLHRPGGLRHRHPLPLPLYEDQYHPSPVVFGMLMATYSLVQFIFASFWVFSDPLRTQAHPSDSLGGTVAGVRCLRLPGLALASVPRKDVNGIAGANA